uniref:Uncharacterized protein n=1 Tax=Erpetoichthys calabaricus TaxID=27687 RepID=A0A8C4RJ09_ERPCA
MAATCLKIVGTGPCLPPCRISKILAAHQLVKSGLTCECCMALSSALSAEHSQLNELWLNNNALGDYGVRLLCEGLRNKNCKLEKLSLRSCHLTSTSCAAFSSALSNEHSRLTELELLGNKLEDLGAHRLCEGLRSPNCKLQKLTLSSCGLTSGCCQAFSSVLSADCTHLNELWLGENNLEDLGVCMLCQGLRNQNCKLEKLRLDSCGLTSGCCSELSLVFSTEHSRLTELELRHNNLEDSGVHQLCEGLRSNNCKIKKLGMTCCDLTSRCCENLSLVLSAEHSHLTELYLNNNNLEDSGVHLLCEGLRNQKCQLEKLRIEFLFTACISISLFFSRHFFSPHLSLWSCGLTSGCCVALSSVLSAEHSHLTQLELNDNNLQDSGVRLLCEGLRNRNCKLEKLG